MSVAPLLSVGCTLEAGEMGSSGGDSRGKN